MLLLYILFGLIVIIAILAAIAPKTFSVERSTVIKCPRNDVFNYVRLHSKRGEWNPWDEKDPNMKKEFEGVDGAVGSSYRWDGNKDVGSGIQTIKSMVENERIDSELQFLKPWKSTSDAYLILEDAENGTTNVRWGINGKNKVPMNIMMLFMNFDKMIGTDFDQGLNKLKGILEG
jgi:hypothetical protein